MTDPARPGSQLVCACGAVSPATARFCSSCGRPLSAAGAGTTVAPRRDDEAITVPHRRSTQERRTVTALFADLSGFTSLAGRLDTEDLLAVVDPVVSGLAAIVHRYGGYIEKFAGDALLALFGAPVAHEDDPVRAVHVALEMHEQVAELGRGTELALHIGINTGSVVARSIEAAGRSQYAALGEPVIVAQRLQSLAAPGETCVGESTAELTRERFDYASLGARAVKGRSEPVAVYRLIGPRTSAALPAAPIVGRDAEIDTVLHALTERRSVYVEGAAGAGKSRLLAEVHDRLAAAQVTVVEIAGSPYAQAAYRCLQPLVAAALRDRYPDEPDLAARLTRLDDDHEAPENALYTGLLMGEAAPSPLDREPQAVRARLQTAAAAWLVELAATAPVVVSIDNLQWLDASAADLLTAVEAALHGRPVTFCRAGRPPQRPAGVEVVVELPALTPADIGRMVSDQLGLLPDARLVHHIADRSQGNPLTAREIARQLRDEQLLDIHHGHARLVAGAEARSLPTSLESLLAERVDRLDPAAADVAAAAAAIGPAVPLHLLDAVCRAGGHTEAETTRAIDDLLSAGFMVRTAPGGDTVRFDSTLLRDVVYARMTTGRRRALHQLVADALAGQEGADEAVDSQGSGLVRLAEHRYLAGDQRAALPLLRRVAQRARAVYAADQAIVALTRAVAAARAVEPASVPTLLCDLADLRMDLGEYERSGQLFAEAASVGNDARAWAGQAATLRRRGDYADGQKSLQQAFHAAPAGDRRLLWCELSWNLSVSGDLGGSLDAARSGLDLADDDDAVTGQLLVQLVRAETLRGDLDDAHDHVDRAIRVFDAVGDLAGLSTALRLLGALQERQGQLADAAQSLERGLELAERTGLVEEIGGCLVNLGMVRGALDDHPAAAACYARAEVVFEQVGHRAGQAVSYGNHAYELFRMGEPESARELGEKGLTLADEVGNHYFSADIHHTLALIAESEDDRPAALRHAEQAVDHFDLAGMPDYAAPSRELADRVRAGG